LKTKTRRRRRRRRRRRLSCWWVRLKKKSIKKESKKINQVNSSQPSWTILSSIVIVAPYISIKLQIKSK
jgi:hypothetical protein